MNDDEIYLFLARKAIEGANLTRVINVFSNGKEALEFLINQSKNEMKLPDLIFLDLTMPIMDGWEFLEDYADLKPKLAKKAVLYIVSSSISPHDISRGKAYAELADFIFKAITTDKYIDIIKNLN